MTRQLDSATFAPAQFDQPRAEAAVRELLIAVGEDPDRHGLIDTPARVARAYREIFGGLYTDPDTVLNTTFDEQHDELVLIRRPRTSAPSSAAASTCSRIGSMNMLTRTPAE